MEGFEELLGVNFWTALFVLLNTLAIFFVAKKFLFKPVMKIIKDRQDEIDGMYQAAGDAKKQAEAIPASSFAWSYRSVRIIVVLPSATADKTSVMIFAFRTSLFCIAA